MKFNITSEEKDDITSYYSNGILVATKKKYIEFYCSIKDGRLSAVRDKEKSGYICKWNSEGLKQIFGNKEIIIGIDSIDQKLFYGKPQPDFIEDYPNLKTGYNGNKFSKIFIKESLINFQNKA